ncbi:MAG: family 1 glycosylhydrolase, partial [Clostridiales bacterium]|nr:family 1 glycosylhydrolase [Clostridiales bacterium]
MNFRKDFIWGVSTASFQIEGGSEPGERGLSLWDTFCETDGRVFGGHHGRTASDHYHHLDEDVDLLGNLGVKAYRFSVSWPRIIPEGIGKINTEGIDFYNHLIDALLARGIEPHLTVFHWDLPYALHVRGGWLNPDVSDWIEAFTTVLVDAFSDRVTNWITLN